MLAGWQLVSAEEEADVSKNIRPNTLIVNDAIAEPILSLVLTNRQHFLCRNDSLYLFLIEMTRDNGLLLRNTFFVVIGTVVAVITTLTRTLSHTSL